MITGRSALYLQQGPAAAPQQEATHGTDSITQHGFGTHAGQPVDRWILRRDTVLRPVELEVITYGAAIRRLVLPDATGTPTDIALGYRQPGGVRGGGENYFGAIVGPSQPDPAGALHAAG